MCAVAVLLLCAVVVALVAACEDSVRESLSILALCVVAAIVYGVLHDLVTAHVCVEYFTIGHPPMFGTESPVLLALGWGVVATWWVGAFLGAVLIVAARFGSRPKRSARSLVWPVAQLMAVVGVFALGAGLLGWVLARAGAVYLLEPLSSNIPPEKHVAFLADLWAHSASYLSGFVGGLVVCARVCFARRTVAQGQAGSPPHEMR